jgi:hypothetical protein
MPQLDTYSFSYQTFTILIFFFVFYIYFLNLFLIQFSKLEQFRRGLFVYTKEKFNKTFSSSVKFFLLNS